MRIIIPLLLIINVSLSARTIFTIGPIFHVNFGGEEVHLSGGIEGACWNINFVNHDDKEYNGAPYGVDLGIEFEKNKVRLYSEFQVGQIVLGVSAGPVIEADAYDVFNTLTLGFQGSVWADYFLGLNLRARYFNDPIYSPGLFLKYPFGDIPFPG